MLGLGLGLNRSNFVKRSIDPAFTMVVDTTLAGSASDTFIIPLVSGVAYDFNVDWGDGNSETVTSSAIASKSHTYSVSGEYTIKITGIFPRIYFNNTGDRLKLMNVSNWGTIVWSSMQDAFEGCANMLITATDTPDFTTATDLRNMLRFCTSLTIGLDTFDTSNIVLMNNMFEGCSSLNCNISTWNTSNVTNMSFMLKNCSVFNQDISNWNIQNVTNMTDLLLNTSFSNENYDLLLVAWEAQNEKPNVTFHAGTAKYSAGAPATARANLVANGWLITDGGQVP